jgi:hypothetical protein
MEHESSAGRRQWAAGRLKKESGVRIQNPGGRNIKSILPFWLLATGYWLL